MVIKWNPVRHRGMPKHANEIEAHQEAIKAVNNTVHAESNLLFSFKYFKLCA